ncbi:DNA topoisomerase [Parachitinimonas caeni]|uniref:DNA topoisomerase n=1 Tax=Parachitinimonas caeni TaxID=3031301 RepID=A0ABT7E321_9NEIS|nr:DNA topoisomerase [Parachitinimonas caeni]MDK2126709.1 DNA topoisomerase [Parachitinimonas caeni]
MSIRILWIAEKLSLAEAVGKVIGTAQYNWSEAKTKQHNIIGDQHFYWLDGHAFEQAEPDAYLPDDIPLTTTGKKRWRAQDLPILPRQWKIQPKPQKQARLKLLENALRQCSVVYHLGDPDEEGQLLVDEALDYFSYRGPVKRVLINDYNEIKVKQALNNIRDNQEPLFQGWSRWALARSRYDWLLGMNATRAMTLRGRQLGFEGLLPVGSAQTPLLFIVRERDRAIESFKPIPYFALNAVIQHANGGFKASWQPRDNQAGCDEEGRLVDAAVADALVKHLSGQPAHIKGYSQTAKDQPPPLPLAMDELQMEAFAQFGYDGQTVLAAAQKLYETYKVTTYPRTTNRYLSEAQHAEAPTILASVFQLRPDLAALAPLLDTHRKSAAFNDKHMEGTPHHGIVPTIPEQATAPANWTEAERNIHDLVVRTYLAQFAAPYRYQGTRVEVAIQDEDFVATGNTPISPGWKAVYAETEGENSSDGESTSPASQTLPLMQQGDIAQCNQCEATARKTTPPSRFDDKLLTEALKNVHKYVVDASARQRLKDGDGIGTSATRAPMIADLKERGLLIPVKPKSKKLMTSPAARALIDALPSSVKDPATAGVFKQRLDQIKQGALTLEAFLDETRQWVTEVVTEAATLPMALPVKPGETCPKCQTGQLKRKVGEKTKQAWWYCSNWNAEPKCDARFQDEAGKPQLNPSAEIPCPKCQKGQLRRKQNEKGAFWFCTQWNADPKCDARYADQKGQPDMSPPQLCPSCQTGELRKREGKSGPFWSCSNWNRAESPCKASYADRKGKPLFETITCPSCGQGELRQRKGIKGMFWGCSNYGKEVSACSATFPDKAGRPDFATAKPAKAV